jgi:hypothetical protein
MGRAIRQNYRLKTVMYSYISSGTLVEDGVFETALVQEMGV